MDGNKLPPLPPSDTASLQRNAFDSFYKIGARSFWENSEINSNEVKEFPKCEHYFIPTKEGVECKKCHAGFIGTLQAKEGKLYVNDELINF